MRAALNSIEYDSEKKCLFEQSMQLRTHVCSHLLCQSNKHNLRAFYLLEQSVETLGEIFLANIYSYYLQSQSSSSNAWRLQQQQPTYVMGGRMVLTRNQH